MPAHSFADEPRDIAERLIPLHHQHLIGVRIEYLFISKARKRNGKTKAGQCMVKRGLDAFLATPGVTSSLDAPDFFVLEFAAPVWEELTDAGKAALVDHELCHARTEETDEGGVRLSTRPHDVEEFGDILRRHGLWEPSIGQMISQLGQQRLFEFAETLPKR